MTKHVRCITCHVITDFLKEVQAPKGAPNVLLILADNDANQTLPLQALIDGLLTFGVFIGRRKEAIQILICGGELLAVRDGVQENAAVESQRLSGN